MLSEEKIKEYKQEIKIKLRDTHSRRSVALVEKDFADLEECNRLFWELVAQVYAVDHILEGN